jgi:3-deoxy-7-phosphoheptulonate synthase
MSFEYIREIPKPKEILAAMPLSQDLMAIKKGRDQDIRAVFTGESLKFLLIIGPCSAHDEEAVCDYISRLAKVQAEVKDKIIIIPRSILTNPARPVSDTRMAHQPNPQGSRTSSKVKAIRRCTSAL